MKVQGTKWNFSLFFFLLIVRIRCTHAVKNEGLRFNLSLVLTSWEVHLLLLTCTDNCYCIKTISNGPKPSRHAYWATLGTRGTHQVLHGDLYVAVHQETAHHSFSLLNGAPSHCALQLDNGELEAPFHRRQRRRSEVLRTVSLLPLSLTKFIRFLNFWSIRRIKYCCRKLDTRVDELAEEFESEWKKLPPETSGDGYSYSRKFVEFCSAKALAVVCQNIQEKISDGSFSRFTFDMMLAWEAPSSADEEASMVPASTRSL